MNKQQLENLKQAKEQNEEQRNLVKNDPQVQLTKEMARIAHESIQSLAGDESFPKAIREKVLSAILKNIRGSNG